MNKKGLTLVELLAVLVVIGLVSLIIYPNITKNMTNSQDKTIEIQKSSIKEAAKLYLADNVEIVDTEIEVTLNKLVEEGYLTGEYKSPKTGKDYDLNISKVKIKKENNEYLYEIELITK